MEKNPDGDASRFVMTTSHRGESLEEASEFLFTCTAIDERTPERFVVLTVGAVTADRAALNETIARIIGALPNPPLQRTGLAPRR
jgi:hypothetical protein